MVKWLFRDELNLAEINVARAALQFAKALAYPDLNVAYYMAMLHELSEDAASRIRSSLPVERQARRLADFLFSEVGFHGDTANYHEPRNSYLNVVLDRRTGIPITLSVIYMDVALRLGLPVYGIGLPGHFIVGVHGRQADLWLDPFHGGRRLSLSDCAELIRMSTGYEGPLEAGWFAPISSRNILARMLANLRASYVTIADWEKAAATIRLLREAQPQEAEHLRDLGLVYYHQGQLMKAAHYLESYLLKVPDAADASMIRDGMKRHLDELVTKN